MNDMFQSRDRAYRPSDENVTRAQVEQFPLQWHLEREENSLESSGDMSLESAPLRALLASMCHARSCNPSDWHPSSKARTA